jgi:hypothetical protein
MKHIECETQSNGNRSVPVTKVILAKTVIVFLNDFGFRHICWYMSMGLIDDELQEVNKLCQHVITGSKLVSCVQTMVRVEIRLVDERMWCTEEGGYFNFQYLISHVIIIFYKNFDLETPVQRMCSWYTAGSYGVFP